MTRSQGICDSITCQIQGEVGYSVGVAIVGPEGLNSMFWMNKAHAKQPSPSLLASPHLHWSAYRISDLEDGRQSRKASSIASRGSIEVVFRRW